MNDSIRFPEREELLRTSQRRRVIYHLWAILGNSKTSIVWLRYSFNESSKYGWKIGWNHGYNTHSSLS